MRKSGKFYTACRPVKAACKGDAEYLGRRNSVLTEYLIEISDTEQQYGVGMSLFHFPILIQQRCHLCNGGSLDSLAFLPGDLLSDCRGCRRCQFWGVAVIAVYVKAQPEG